MRRYQGVLVDVDGTAVAIYDGPAGLLASWAQSLFASR